VAPNLVLTAAHCNYMDGKVRVGSIYARGVETTTRNSNKKKKSGIEANIITRYQHPMYIQNATTLANDFMLLEIDQTIDPDLYPPIHLNFDTQLPSDGDWLTVIGFGVIDSEGDQSDILQQIRIPAMGFDSCKDQYQQDGIVLDYNSHFCAGSSDFAEDSCQGDSGGPIFQWDTTINDYSLMGVVSFGSSSHCGRNSGDSIEDEDESFPGIYARIATNVDWLRTEICSRAHQKDILPYCRTKKNKRTIHHEDEVAKKETATYTNELAQETAVNTNKMSEKATTTVTEVAAIMRDKIPLSNQIAENLIKTDPHFDDDDDVITVDYSTLSNPGGLWDLFAQETFEKGATHIFMGKRTKGVGHSGSYSGKIRTNGKSLNIKSSLDIDKYSNIEVQFYYKATTTINPPSGQNNNNDTVANNNNNTIHLYLEIKYDHGFNIYAGKSVKWMIAEEWLVDNTGDDNNWKFGNIIVSTMKSNIMKFRFRSTNPANTKTSIFIDDIRFLGQFKQQQQQ